MNLLNFSSKRTDIVSLPRDDGLLKVSLAAKRNQYIIVCMTMVRGKYEWGLLFLQNNVMVHIKSCYIANSV